MKKVASLFAVIISFLSFPQLVYAAQMCPPGWTNLCKIKLDNGGGVAGTIISYLLIIAIILALVFLIVGAIKWITSSGDEAKIKAARSTMVAAIVGLVLSLLAFFIVNVLLTMFTGQGISGLKILKLVQ